MRVQYRAELVPDRQVGVQGERRILEHHRDAPAAGERGLVADGHEPVHHVGLAGVAQADTEQADLEKERVAIERM